MRPTGEGFRAMLGLLKRTRIARRKGTSGLSIHVGFLRRDSPLKTGRPTMGRCGGYVENTKSAIHSVVVDTGSELTFLRGGRMLQLLSGSRLGLSSVNVKMGKSNRAGATLFYMVPSDSGSCGFVVNVLCARVFRRLCCRTSFGYKNELPVRIAFVLSRFTGITLPSSFYSLLSAVQDHRVSDVVVVRGFTRLGTLFGSA